MLERKRQLFLFSSGKFPARFVEKQKTVNKELKEKYREREIEGERE